MENSISGRNQRKHGGTGTRLFNIWRGMLKRVDAKEGEAAEKYSLRGIGVIAEWRNFIPFRDWALSNGYSDDLTIERRDNDGDYRPSNCVWADLKVQARNRRTSRRLTAFGKTCTLAEWAENSGLSQETLAARIRMGWIPEEAISRPLRADRRRNSHA